METGMMEISRQALLIGDPRLAGTAALSLQRFSWQFQRTSCLDEAEQMIQDKPPLLGVILLGAHHASPSPQLDRLLTRGPTTLWVALLDPGGLKDRHLFGLIARHCHAFLPLPLNPERAHHVLESALTMAGLMATTFGPPHPTAASPQRAAMIGRSEAIQTLLRDIEKIAAVDAPVLITGESGTGKELTARLIHERSSRRKGPFHAVNCGALPAGLIQSELFGHEKGAFTGADRSKVGIIESAAGGTLFLDEIGDLPLELQVNLLRFLEDHRFFRLGSLRETEVDVRVLAATHVDLEDAVEAGRFREDLYHRLNVLQARTPPLRERPEDIEELAGHFLEQFRAEAACRVRGFSHDSLVTMRQYHWPGNIRELINRVRRAVVMCEQRLITPDNLGLERRKDIVRCHSSLDEIRDGAERDAVIAALARNKHQVLHAARDLGVSRATLYRLIEKHRVHRSLSGQA
ncbi:sigma-54 dependent transcriptional regulator [Halomonas sp. 3H]|uniref:sigma-54 dependent transcriptional regulator n=1 Tax=Halomonas sp. 3H TaxID=2952527 RepID=UPI0020B70C19|nr:sigma-54 dependent transcriptional regulator [Halomonas sp. 3H]